MAQRRPVSAANAAVRALRLVATASPRTFIAAAALQLIGAVAAIALVYAAKLTLDAVLLAEDGTATPSLVAALGVLAFATAIGGVAGVLQAQQQRILAEDVGTHTWQDLVAVLGRVDMELIDSPTFSEQSERLQTNALNRPLSIATATLGLLGSGVTVTSLTVAVLTLEPLLVPVLLLAGLPSVYLSQRASASEFDFSRRWSDVYRLRHYHRQILSTPAFAKEVRSFQLQRENERRHLELSAEYRTGLVQQVRRRQLMGLASALFTGVVLALALGVIVWLLTSDRMTLSDAGAAVVAVRLLSGALNRVFSSVGTIVESSVFLTDLHRFLETAEVSATDESGAMPLQSRVSLTNVRFRYPETDRDVLEDINIEIEAGQFIGLVGENGSGKSTLAKIVSGLYAPTAGEFMWDGLKVSAETREAVRRSVGTVLQDFAQYDLSAADNIELGSDVDADRLWSAARRARVDDVLADLPNGIRTILGRRFEGAIDLSRGQWQRVALARALAKERPVLVLDEPSSALDPRTEHQLFADLRALAGQHAVLLVSHRYGSLHLTDRIIVLQDGRVVDEGTHEDLLARGGLYAQLYTMQAQSYRPA